ncbi:MAG TPA: chemotaxis protein CheW [Allosphingosinicella sp.]|jgi:purine-binding chemotaxis protein CheW
MDNLLLIVTLAGSRVAMRASEVDSVVEIESLTGAPRTAPHVAGLAALRSRVLTVIDCRAALEFGGYSETRTGDAVMALVEGHPYALLVDSVEDVVEAESALKPVCTTLSGGWGRVAAGMVEAEGDLLLLVDVARLIAGPAAAAA